VFYLDANRNCIDVYNLGWKAYLLQREQDEHRRKKERANAEKRAEILQKQGEKMRAKASKATAAQGMLRRAEKLRSGLDDVRVADKVAKLRFPTPAPCGKTPLSGEELIALGWTVCSDLDSGVKIKNVSVGVKNELRLIESAVINFCPDWFPVID
jgi:ATPase subunit of ABC transporter with duplicated ATPase domains